MSLESIQITGYNSGVQLNNKKPFLIPDDAFANLYNAYVWREQVRKREGLKLVGRLRRVFTVATIGNTGASVWNFNIYTAYGLTAEATAEIEPGSVIINLATPIIFTDQGNGILQGDVIGNNGYIDYTTGDVFLTHTAGAGIAATASFNYFPGLPVMGSYQRERAGVNDEQTVFFDTKYAYKHDGVNFQEFLVTSPITSWAGTDSDFFWCTNYRGSEAFERLFFVTNFVNSASNPMRYTDSSTWTTFQPIVSSTQVTQTLGAIIIGAVAFAGVIGTLPFIKGTLVITVGPITFRDTPEDGTLVTSGANSGTIDYVTGAVNLTFNPATTFAASVEAVYRTSENYIFTARILIPYYGRLLALNVYEGPSNAGAQNYFNRCRYSQVGSPIQQDSWLSDVFGKGGFIDAPINEEIISVQFYKNVLIVQFERSTWRLQYIGEYGIPFIWERISSDWGSESTFSTVLFDSGILTVGDKAIVSSSGNDVQRIDLDIPDLVYLFNNSEHGTTRVHGIRDYKKEVVYWCYPDYSALIQGQYFPNRTLLYNYRNNTFAIFRNNTTCFGNFQYPVGITWDRVDVFWDDYDVSWDSAVQESVPTIVSGNQEGFIHFFTSPNSETAIDSLIDANDQESLSVTDINVVSSTVQLTINNHNLQSGEWIYLTGLKFVNTPSPPSAGSTDLNNQIYVIRVEDADTITLFRWNFNTQAAATNFSYSIVGTYVGGGVVALFPNINIRTKDFNPAKQIGNNIQTSYIDFLFDSTPNSIINVVMRMNTSAVANGNILIGNQQVEMTNGAVGFIQDISLSSPCIIESKSHGLLDGDVVLFQQIGGTTQLNNTQYAITFLTEDTFSIPVDSSLYTPYTFGGQWIQTSLSYYTPGAQYAWYRFYANTYGQFVTLELSYDGNLMAQLSTHQSNFVLNAIQLYYRPAGKNIFGK